MLIVGEDKAAAQQLRSIFQGAGYFTLRALRLPTVEEALRSGEGQNVEFKRGLFDDPKRGSISEEALLKSIAAFANTNDGVIFIGVDDHGRVTGLGFDFKQKERFEQRIWQLVRSRIKPVPPMEVGLEDVRRLVVAKITVAHGDAPAYMIGGAVYLRSGSSDIQAQPDDRKGSFLNARLDRALDRSRAGLSGDPAQLLAGLSHDVIFHEKVRRNDRETHR